MRSFALFCSLAFWHPSSCFADEMWVPARIVSFQYPPLALQAMISGFVEVECTVSGDGSVTRTEVRSGHPILGRSVVEQIGKWRFRASSGSVLVNVVAVSVEFRLEGTPVDHSTSTFVYDYPYSVIVSAPPLLRSH